MKYKSLIICCFKVSNANYHWDGIKVLVWGFCCIKSSSLELDLNKLGFLSVALQIRSQYPGSWQGKRIFSSWENCTRPTGWKGLRHDQPPYCLYSTSEHIFIPSFHFSPYYVTFFFFFFAWMVIIQRFSRATICDTAEGPGQFPEHTAMTDVICAHTQEPEFDSKTFHLCLCCRIPCTYTIVVSGIIYALWNALIRLWLKWKADL